MIRLNIITETELGSVEKHGKLPLGFPMGDPSGIGPEILLALVKTIAGSGILPVIFGSLPAFKEAAAPLAGKRNGRFLFHTQFSGSAHRAAIISNTTSIENREAIAEEAFFVDIDSRNADKPFAITDDPHRRKIIPGRTSAYCGKIALKALEGAVRMAECREIAGIVTAPLSKKSVREGGEPAFTGQTGWLTDYFGLNHEQTGMMFCAGEARLALLTQHEPLSAVPDLVTRERITAIAGLTHKTLTDWFGICKPRMCVLGLNPHSGEEGAFGREEADEIIPAIDSLRHSGLNVSGPVPGDSAFRDAGIFRDFDAVIAMYHDQGLAPLKALFPYQAVNLTMGLPVIRVSPDHGTAFDIAGKGLADERGFLAAINLAELLCEKCDFGGEHEHPEVSGLDLR